MADAKTWIKSLTIDDKVSVLRLDRSDAYPSLYAGRVIAVSENEPITVSWVENNDPTGESDSILEHDFNDEGFQVISPGDVMPLVRLIPWTMRDARNWLRNDLDEALHQLVDFYGEKLTYSITDLTTNECDTLVNLLRRIQAG